MILVLFALCTVPIFIFLAPSVSVHRDNSALHAVLSFTAAESISVCTCNHGHAIYIVFCIKRALNTYPEGPCNVSSSFLCFSRFLSISVCHHCLYRFPCISCLLCDVLTCCLLFYPHSNDYKCLKSSSTCCDRLCELVVYTVLVSSTSKYTSIWYGEMI